MSVDCIAPIGSKFASSVLSMEAKSKDKIKTLILIVDVKCLLISKYISPVKVDKKN